MSTDPVYLTLFANAPLSIGFFLFVLNRFGNRHCHVIIGLFTGRRRLGRDQRTGKVRHVDS